MLKYIYSNKCENILNYDLINIFYLVIVKLRTKIVLFR